MGASVVRLPSSSAQPVDELVGHRPDPGAQRVAVVVRRGLGGEPVEEGVVDRQREPPLDVAEREVVAGRRGELRARRAGAVRACVVGPGRLADERACARGARATCLEVGEHRGAVARGAVRRGDV